MAPPNLSGSSGQTDTPPSFSIEAPLRLPEGPPPGGGFLLEPVIRSVFTRERFSDEQLEIERMVRKLAREEILPVRDRLEKLDPELTRELLGKCAELGLTAVDIPEEYGGMGLDKTTSALVVEALTTGGSASWIVTFSAHVGIGTLPVVFFGTEEQKARYLPKLGSVEYLGAYALTEPGSGSDVTHLATTARPTEDGTAFVLDGTKQFVTNGAWADLYVVFASLDGAGVTAFLVERGSEGLTVGPEEHKLGIKGSSTVSLILDGVVVPAANLLGEPGGGLPIALNILNVGRFKLGAADLGGCKSVIDQALGYALERTQFGQPIAYFEAIRRKFADMAVRTYGLDSAIYRTVGLMDERVTAAAGEATGGAMAALEEYAIESSIAKVLGSETMARVADHGVQIYGGYGFSEEYPMAGVYRDTRIDRLFEGTNEINRMVIYGYFLKKGLMEELPILGTAARWLERADPIEGPLAWEAGALDAGRRLTVKLFFEAISRYGQDLRNAQIVGEDLADLAIGYYQASAALNRLSQLGAERPLRPVDRALGRLLTATYLEEFWRLAYRLRASLCTGPWGARITQELDRELAELHLPFDPVPEIARLTDHLYERGAYDF
jgi:hypothetical protein